MNFLCPNCKARYKIADEKLTGRARARMSCKKCGTIIELSREGDGQFVVGKSDSSAPPASNSLIPEAANVPALPDASGSPPKESAQRFAPQVRHQDAEALASLVAAVGKVEEEWFVAVAGKPIGPFQIEGVVQQVREGKIGLQTLVWHDGLADWRPVASFPRLAAAASDLHTAIDKTPPPGGLNVERVAPVPPVTVSRPSILPRLLLLIFTAFAVGAVAFLFGRPLMKAIRGEVALPAAGEYPNEAPAGDDQPPAAAGLASSTAKLDLSDVERTVSKHSPAVHAACWPSAVKARSADAPSSIRVSLVVTVAPSGVVQAITSSGQPRGYPGLMSCIEAQVKTWSFEPSSTATRVQVPFEFVVPDIVPK